MTLKTKEGKRDHDHVDNKVVSGPVRKQDSSVEMPSITK